MIDKICKTEIKNLTMKVAGQEISLSLEQAKELYFILHGIFKHETVTSPSVVIVERTPPTVPIPVYVSPTIVPCPSWKPEFICQTLSLTATTQ